MSDYGFFIQIHVDRFSDLSLVVGKHKVYLDLMSMGEDCTVEVFISGEEPEIIRKLDGSLWRIREMLSTPPVVEGV